MPQINLTTEIIVAIVSALAAIASAIYAWWGTRIARRALKISELDHKERHAELTAYLIEGRICDDSDGTTTVSFACSVANTASAPLSITRADLHIHAFDRTGKTSEIILQPSAKGIPTLWQSPALELPLNLGARNTVSGWLGYRLPAHVVQNLLIDKYEVALLSSNGERATFESHLLKRVSNVDQTGQ